MTLTTFRVQITYLTCIDKGSRYNGVNIMRLNPYLDIVVEDAVLVSVLLQETEGVLVSKVFKLNEDVLSEPSITERWLSRPLKRLKNKVLYKKLTHRCRNA